MVETVNAARALLNVIDARKPQIVELAMYLSLAARIEPVLLRKTRLTFLPKSEPGLEADLWFSPLVQSRGSDAIMLRTDIVILLREDLAAQEESSGRSGRPLDRAWELLQVVHCTVPVALRLEEEITYLALSGRPDAKNKIEEQLQKVAATMAQAAHIGDLARWVSRALPRLPQIARQTGTASVLALAASVRLGNYRILDVSFPDENARSWLPDLLPKNLARVRVGVRLFGQSVEFGDPDLEESRVLDVPKTNPVLLEVSWDEEPSTYIRWEPGQTQRIMVETGLILIRTLLGETYRLRSLSIPVPTGISTPLFVESGQVPTIQESMDSTTSVDFSSSTLQHDDEKNIPGSENVKTSKLSDDNSAEDVIDIAIATIHENEFGVAPESMDSTTSVGFPSSILQHDNEKNTSGSESINASELSDDKSADEMKADIAIITIREDEFDAVFDRLEKHEFKNLDGPSGRTYATFFVPTITNKICEVALVRSPEQGNDASHKVAIDMLQDLDPQILLVVGIAGGIPDDKFTLGDVIISSRIDNFNVSAVDRGKITYNMAGGIHPRISNITASLRMYRSRLAGWNTLDGIKRPPVDLSQIQSNIYGDQEWRDKVLASLAAQFGESASRSQLPLFKTGIVASSNTLLMDTEIATQWQQHARGFLAVEMEAAGAFQATQQINQQCPVMTICGISDIIGLKRDSRWTTYACQSAAAFTYTFIKAGIIVPRNTSSTTAIKTEDDNTKSLRVFIIYSKEDEKFKIELEKHTIMLRRDGTIRSMDSQQIEAGKEQNEVTKAIDQAQIILLLISPNFLASDDLYNVEMGRAIERHEAGAARVVPILISEADMEEIPFSKLVALPRSLKPIDQASNRDAVWTQIAREIRAVCNSLLASQKQS